VSGEADIFFKRTSVEILRTIAEFGKPTQRKIVRETGTTSAHVVKKLKEFSSYGLVVHKGRIDDGTRGRNPYVYKLTGAGQELVGCFNEIIGTLEGRKQENKPDNSAGRLQDIEVSAR